MDEHINKRLVFAKYLLLQGKQQLSKHLQVAANCALLNFHDATELLLVCIAQEIKIDSARQTFPQLVQEIFREEAISSHSLNELNYLRVRLKHSGDNVSLEKVQELSVLVERVFVESVLRFWHCNYVDLRLSMIINDESVRQHLKMAEDHLAKRDIEMFLQELALAFSHTKYSVQPSDLTRTAALSQKLKQTRSRTGKTELGSTDSSMAFLEDVIEEIEKGFKRIQDDLAVMMSGINLRDYHFFRAMTPNVSVSLDGTRRMSFSRNSEYQHEWNLTQTNLEALLSFVIETNLRLESDRRRLISTRDAPKRKLLVNSDDTPIYSDTVGGSSVICHVKKNEELHEAFPIPLDFNNEWFMVSLPDGTVHNDIEYSFGYVRRNDVLVG
jgi:hypothetical protein